MFQHYFDIFGRKPGSWLQFLLLPFVDACLQRLKTDLPKSVWRSVHEVTSEQMVIEVFTEGMLDAILSIDVAQSIFSNLILSFTNW